MSDSEALDDPLEPLSTTPDTLTRTASSPFDRDDADLIIRTSDEIDFCVHTPVLSIASPVLSEILSNRMGVISGPDGRQVLRLPEKSDTIEPLLKLCYPVPRPQLRSLRQIRDVLNAATNYDIQVIGEILETRLVAYAEKYPLQVYAIACRNNLENTARTAADHAVRKPFWETYHRDIEYITAGAYWRLLAYYWDVEKKRSQNKKNRRPKLLWKGTEATSSLPSTKAPSPFPSSASPPFDETSDGDVALKSSDEVLFRAHRVILSLASPFFKDMFSLPQASPQLDGSGTGHIVPFTEPSETIDTLLRFVYPDEDPDLKHVQEIEGVVEAAIKYDMPKCISAMRKKLILCASKEPIRVFMIACKNNLADVASAAAHLSLRRPILYSFELGSVVLPCSALEDITAGSLFRLIEYQRQCSKVANDAMSDLTWTREDFTWRTKMNDAIVGSCKKCIRTTLELGEEHLQVVGWWYTFYQELKALVRQRPCSALILELESLMDKALVEAAKCADCFKDSIHTLRTFRTIVTQHLDKRLAEVKIRIDF
ncbi:hypothetical protein BJ322DRAFT_613704 [Thelephora terrestris]|uniref:BTB domain-containing protein n=1 Tax=Thelephora terrestris TaxID=56493 RepID=A0A9P6HKQ9_9AGAM|nr:hypothetical protein BJ322DRAFT_613704 [Thelephora terrestris]